MFRPLTTVLAVLALACPLVAQTYTWNPANNGSSPWNTTSAVWSTTGTTPYNQVFANGEANNAVLELTSGTADLTAGTAINFGQLRIGSDGFTLTSGASANGYTFNQGFQTLGGARTINLAVGAGASTSFVASGTGDTTAGKLTINLSSAVNGHGINLNSSTVFGANPNVELIVNSTTGGSGGGGSASGGTRVLLGNMVTIPSGVSMTLTSNATGDIRTRVTSVGGIQTWSGAVSLQGNGTVEFDNSNANNLVFSGGVSSGTNTTNLLVHGTGTGTISGVMSGEMGLTKSQGGRWNLAQTDSTFTGQVLIGTGTLGVAKLADAGQTSSLGAATGTASSILFGQNSSPLATLEYTGTASSSTNRTVILQGTAVTAVPTHVISTGNNFNAARTVSFTGDITTAATADIRALVLTGSNPGNNTISGNISNAGGSLFLEKSGAAGSVWILSGTNTYTGVTRITNGILVVNGDHSAATGAVTVGGGASTLAGTGTIGGVVTVSNGTNGATIRGDSGGGTGNLNLLSDVTVNAGSGEFFRGGVHTQLTTSSGAITGNSKLALSGAGSDLNFANITGSNTFAITLGNDGGLTSGQSYTVTLATADAGTNFLRNGNSATAFSNSDFTLVSGSGNWLFTGTSLVRSGNELRLTFTPTPVPEPTTVGLAVAVGGLVVAGWRRFRR